MLHGPRNVSLTAYIVTALVMISGVLGATRQQPHVAMPLQTDVSSVQVVLNSTSSNPMPILSDSSQGKVIIPKLLQWLESAKSMGYEQSSPYMMSMGPTEVVFNLNNHKQIEISEAWLPATFTEPNGRVVQGLRRSNDYVDIRSSETSQMIRYDSPQLVNWLISGWPKDWKQ